MDTRTERVFCIGSPSENVQQGCIINRTAADCYGAVSMHPGGINACFGDGSVRFIKDGINRTIWWSLGTKANGDLIS
ncbi:MAG TPA: H-X9-DG-CTERM domain-containing protein, partial [Isosphaeraceae bacterium]|nr:H-X9-DG-CTERM domain-containing protein [Isosphaeraceae bacterium]